ncbi:MAG: DUF6883 domain-containing protein [Planctomycetota bacterium]
MAFPGAETALVPREKLVEYLLNADHPAGAAKASWFNSLGYDREAAELLAEDLVAVANSDQDYEVDETAWGTKFIARGLVGRTPGRRAVVITVWITLSEAPPRLVTAYPAD